MREADLRGCERVEIDGEYVLLIEYVRAGVSVSVARARRRECLARANALIEEHARARDSLVAIEPVIAGLTENGARRALLARIAAVGGSVAWEDACTADLEAAELLLGYRGRDAIVALIEGGALVAVREPGQPPRLQLTGPHMTSFGRSACDEARGRGSARGVAP